MRFAGAFALSLALTTPAAGGGAQQAKASVIAGVAIPATPLSRRAESYVRSQEPDFLYNHSVRTYLFGALWLKAKGLSYEPETAYVASLFHDWGLVPGHASARFSFEIDGANKAEEFVKANGGTPEQARTVWNAIVMHDMGRPYQAHHRMRRCYSAPGPEVMSTESIRRLFHQQPSNRFSGPIPDCNSRSASPPRSLINAGASRHRRSAGSPSFA